MSARPEGVRTRDAKGKNGVVTLYREHVLGLERAVRRARTAVMSDFAGLVEGRGAGA